MKPLITLFCLLVAAKASAQKPPTAPIVAKALVARRDSTTESDTSKENKEPRYYYFSVNTNVFVNTKGGVAKRFHRRSNLAGLTVFLISGWPRVM